MITYEKFAEAVGNRIRHLRVKMELTQEELSSNALITRQHLQRIEAGGADNPGLVTLYNIASALCTTVGKLLTEAYREGQGKRRWKHG
jgi:transcriptional regulator with XRE-family HTH domain